jgi:hypothetical protein
MTQLGAQEEVKGNSMLEDNRLTIPKLANAIGGGMCNLAMRISRWGGRTVAPDVIVEDQFGTDVSDRTTRPCLTLDRIPSDKKRCRPYVHELFSLIDKNGSALTSVRDRYTVPDSLDGLHLLSLARAPKVIQILSDLKMQREGYVREMKLVWDSEIVPAMKKNHETDWERIKSYVPKAAILHERFRVVWDRRPLTPMSNDDLDLSKLSPQAAADVMEKSDQMMQEVMESRVKAVAAQVFGELDKLCDDILAKKKGVSKELLDKIILMGNMDLLANEAVTMKASRVREILEKNTSRSINSDAKVASAVRSALSEFSRDLKEITIDLGLGTRSTPDIEL